MKETKVSAPRRELLKSGVLLGLSASIGQSLALPRKVQAKTRNGLPDWLRIEDFDKFVEDANRTAGLPKAWLLEQFAEAKRQDKALALANPTPSPSAPPRSFRRTLASSLTPSVIAEGQKYLNLHAASFAKAEEKFGVPAPILCAILGVETRYGKVLGRYPSVDTLASLAFASPRRQDYFRSELLALLKMGHKKEISLDGLKGSYAGALGIPQFMPSNWGRFGEDLDGDGQLNLVSSPADAIGSVAKFLRMHGWMTGQPVHTSLTESQRRLVLDPALSHRFVTQGLRPLDTVGLLAGLSLVPSDHGFPPETPASIILLPEVDNEGPAWMAGPNFFAICQYNRSYLYAASVTLLSAAFLSY